MLNQRIVIFISLAVLLIIAVAIFKSSEVLPPKIVSQIPTVQLNREKQKKNVAVKPSQVINLTNWKLTLPYGPQKDAFEIRQPRLANFDDSPWFTTSTEQNAVVFRAPVNGATTENSEYPRSELREMVGGGKDEIAWSSSVGKHTMFLEQAITAVPKTKRHVVTGQIHDEEDDVIVIRFDYPKLYVSVDGENKGLLDPEYTLGKRFTVKFEVENDETKIYYNGSLKPVYTLPKSYFGAYFKAGVYTQSNCSREKPGLCNAENYGEVTLYKLEVIHQ